MCVIVTNVLHVVRVLREDSQEEFRLFVGLEGRRDDAVGAGWEFEPAADFSEVDEGRRPGY